MRFPRLISIFACGLILVSFSPVNAQSDPDVVEECAALLPDDRPMPTGADAPSIRFVSPTDGETVIGREVALTVETENFDIASGLGHWHLWVDGQLVGMLYQNSGVTDLTPGTHQLCASIGDPNHMDIGMPAGITITVEQPAAGAAVPTLSISRESAPIISEPGVNPMRVVLLVGLGLGAAVGGWWLGSRLPKGRKSKS